MTLQIALVKILVLTCYFYGKFHTMSTSNVTHVYGYGIPENPVSISIPHTRVQYDEFPPRSSWCLPQEKLLDLIEASLDLQPDLQPRCKNLCPRSKLILSHPSPALICLSTIQLSI